MLEMRLFRGRRTIIRLAYVAFVGCILATSTWNPAVSQSLAENDIQTAVKKVFERDNFQTELPLPTTYKKPEVPAVPEPPAAPELFPEPEAEAEVELAPATHAENERISKPAQFVLWSILIIACILIAFNVARELKMNPAPRLRKVPEGGSNQKRAAPVHLPKPNERTLREVDRNAAQGNYKEAIHLLLGLCIEQVQGQFNRETLLSMTNREILGKADLPENALSSFSTIVSAEELSQFGHRHANQSVFKLCRDQFTVLQNLRRESNAG